MTQSEYFNNMKIQDRFN